MFVFLGASNGVAKMCQIKDCAICNAGQEFLKEEENQSKKGLEPVCCKKQQKSPNQEIGLGNRGYLKVLNDTKLILNE